MSNGDVSVEDKVEEAKVKEPEVNKLFRLVRDDECRINVCPRRERQKATRVSATSQYA